MFANSDSYTLGATETRMDQYTLQSHHLEVVGETNIQTRNDCLFGDTETECSEDLDDEDHMMPGLLQEGISYTIKRQLVQGWIHKKGTGSDWLASRAWKARWAVLVLAKVPGHHAEIPMLQIYWSPSVLSPSTVILLNTAVVLPMDLPDNTNWNCHQFEIRHVKKPLDNACKQISRFFSCPKEGRDRWVYTMNEALLEYEKEKAYRRKSLVSMSSPPRILYAVQDALPPKAFQNSKQPRLTVPLAASTARSPAPLPEPPLSGTGFVNQKYRK